MLDSGEIWLNTTFHNIRSSTSAISADSFKNNIFEKKGNFSSKIGSKFRDVTTGPIGKLS